MSKEVITRRFESLVGESSAKNAPESVEEHIIQPDVPQEHHQQHNDTIESVVDLNDTSVRERANDFCLNFGETDTVPKIDLTNASFGDETDGKAEQDPRETVSEKQSNKRKRGATVNASEIEKYPNKKTKLTNNSNQHKCDECNFSTSSESDLRKHMQCHICCRWFCEKDAYYQHMGENHGIEFPFKCSLCADKFSDVEKWKSHENGCKLK